MKFLNSKKAMIIIGIILGIVAMAYIVFYFYARNDKYILFEREMMTAAKAFLEANESRAPEDEERGVIIKLRELHDTLFILEPLANCDMDVSYVFVKLEEEELIYEAYLKCRQYETKIITDQ